ncbi:selenide, water dikinase SelD [Sulfitobacter mediterraneus]|uniref:selenide, water dikinase SelD n=1 Tax=Sulfitobacter mediterraneus TaxID=83219 RepID=UPI0021A449C3|nr:selenide, water dikinase SelD [Sulfitobacter mediterraneus]
MQSNVPLTRDLVLVGGGHAHALVLRSWGMNPLSGVRLTVINPGPTAPYTGMLPGHVAGHYGRDTLEIDLVRLCRHAGARLILDKACGIDRAARQVLMEGRMPVAYDVASIDVGITAQMDLPGFAEHGVGAKPLDVYASRWRDFLAQVQAGQAAPEVAVIGGGVAGCELALAMAHALRQVGVVPDVTVIEAAAEISGVGASARRRLLAQMKQLGVAVRCGAQVTRVGAQRVEIAGQEAVAAALCVGAAGAFAHEWVGGTDLPLQDGFIRVDETLAVEDDPALFAVGDCAHMPFAPRPKAGVYAVRAAPVLHHNLRAALGVGRRRRFKPQAHYLKLISLGGKSAMAEKFGMSLSGPLLWRWKDRIDRAFMEKFTNLPVMQTEPPRGPVAAGVHEMLEAAPLCGGCGAKVGGGVLGTALDHLKPVSGAVLTGAGDDAAVLRQPGGGFQVISTDHLRAMIADPVCMTQVAAVHALGDIWAMGAKPQVALAHLILPQMAPDLQARTLAEITQAASAVMGAAGAQLVGGHTTMGAELTVGFTVTGVRDEMPITVSGAQDGDLLVLTRPIGTGVIFAADMQGKADGRDVAAALQTMQKPQDIAAAALANAHAMTDVTGFGLAGHVRAICRASMMDADLWQDQIPVYGGARALSDRGIASSLMPANRRDAQVAGVDDPLLYDPQTAGGLLAALPPNAAAKAVAQLQVKGITAAVIGTLSAGQGAVTLAQRR